MKSIRIVLFSIIVFSMLSASVVAGVYMSGTVDNNGKTDNMQMFVEKDRMRVETMGGKQIMIYRDDLQKFWMVKDGKYTEMTKEDMKKMGEQMNSAMKMMEEKMQGLPKEQQELMKKYMKGNMPGQMADQEAPKTKWKRVGSEKVKNWECEKYKSNDGKTAWTVKPEQLGLAKDDFKIFEKVQDFFSEMMKGNESFLKYTSTDDNDGLTGFPVKMVSADGKEQLVNEITKKDLASNLFELQKNWKKEDSPMMQMK
jgi:hypothetical protein